MQRNGNKQFGTFELQETLRPREQLRATRKRVVVVIMKRIDFFILPFLLGNAIMIMRTINSSSSLGRPTV
jgi:hypothetical protein